MIAYIFHRAAETEYFSPYLNSLQRHVVIVALERIKKSKSCSKDVQMIQKYKSTITEHCGNWRHTLFSINTAH